MKNHDAFYQYVRNYITENPEASAHLSNHVAAGIEESRRETLTRAADMEVALAVAIAKRYGGREKLILSKLKKWNGRSAIRWDDTIAMLESKP